MSLEQAITDLCTVVKELTYAVSTLTETIKAQASNVTTEPVKRPRRTKAQIEADDAAAKTEADSVAAAEKHVDDAAKALEQTIPASRGTTTAQLVTMHLAAEATLPPDKTADQQVFDDIHKEERVAPATPPTKEETLAAFQALVAKYGKEAATEKARKILAALGAPNISGLPEDKRAAAIAAVTAELGGVQ